MTSDPPHYYALCDALREVRPAEVQSGDVQGGENQGDDDIDMEDPDGEEPPGTPYSGDSNASTTPRATTLDPDAESDGGTATPRPGDPDTNMGSPGLNAEDEQVEEGEEGEEGEEDEEDEAGPAYDPWKEVFETGDDDQVRADGTTKASSSSSPAKASQSSSASDSTRRDTRTPVRGSLLYWKGAAGKRGCTAGSFTKPSSVLSQWSVCPGPTAKYEWVEVGDGLVHSLTGNLCSSHAEQLKGPDSTFWLGTERELRSSLASDDTAPPCSIPGCTTVSRTWTRVRGKEVDSIVLCDEHAEETAKSDGGMATQSSEQEDPGRFAAFWNSPVPQQYQNLSHGEQQEMMFG
ncbi:hypothetical protein BCR39DRAFT_506655 [Naematelia encephala]|uniref:Uncharacterized protein n=1 Tax=Naematelia encephala TaxID=71784 RepID=A0A1Y2AV49_9TREE|nr:hypothetical protein BCR39DRAFT_506655 [Naematelia encephala]